jgi:type IV fimbrial biogenesis protein FimT
MIGLVVVGILSALAGPSFSAWIQNQQIRTGAESILNGIQITRSEAVKSNAQARFVLCNLPASSWEVRAASATAAANPVASPVCGTTVPAGEVRVQERSGQEGSKSAQVAVNNGAIGVTTINTVTFNGLGRVAANSVMVPADASASVTQIVVSTPTGNRNLQINVGAGGNTRMCDPSLAAGSDPRAC